MQEPVVLLCGEHWERFLALDQHRVLNAPRVLLPFQLWQLSLPWVVPDPKYSGHSCNIWERFPGLLALSCGAVPATTYHHAAPECPFQPVWSWPCEDFPFTSHPAIEPVGRGRWRRKGFSFLVPVCPAVLGSCWECPLGQRAGQQQQQKDLLFLVACPVRARAHTHTPVGSFQGEWCIPLPTIKQPLCSSTQRPSRWFTGSGLVLPRKLFYRPVGFNHTLSNSV